MSENCGSFTNKEFSYQFNDRTSTQTDGGILVYYVSYAPGKITAFKPVSFPRAEASIGQGYFGARMLTKLARVSACWLVTRTCVHGQTRSSQGRTASVATRAPTSAAMSVLLAWTTAWTPRSFPLSPAPVASAPTFSSRRKFAESPYPILSHEQYSDR